MRGFLSIGVVFVVACGSNHGQSVCDNQVPPPAVCMQACDPSPGAPNTCPAGYHCTPDGHCDAVCTPTGGQCGDGYKCTMDGQCVQDVAAQCMSMGLPTTSLSGTVFAPNGTLPLYGVTVYVSGADPGPMPAGAQCNKCSDSLPGSPLAQATTDESGHFQLLDVPSGQIYVVVVSGKWRRVLTLANTNMCADNPLAAADTTFPKSKTDMTPNTKSVDLPKIAISTGGADALECLFRKLGIADSEFGTAGGAQSIHLYTDTQSAGQGADKFAAGFGGGTGNFADSQQMLWSSVDKLKPYDAVILSCEGEQASNTKSQANMDAMKMYADLGGRVFASHWHNIWIEGATTPAGPQKPAVWPTIAMWNNSNTTFGPDDDIIDEANNPKGTAFANWMQNVVPGSTRDHIAIQSQTGKNTVTSVDTAKAERWTYWPSGNQMLPQNFQFTTPNEAAADNRCGKVVFSDMHVASGSTSSTGTPFPGGCSTAALTPQEKALAFMLFDLSSCVGTLF